MNNKGLRILLLVHGLVTLAAGIALVMRPGFIPALVGAQLGSSGFIVAYLLAGAEFGFSFLSFECALSADAKILRVAAHACAAFHGMSALLELYAYANGLGPIILLNIAVRVVVVALFLLLARANDPAPRSTSGRK